MIENSVVMPIPGSPRRKVTVTSKSQYTYYYTRLFCHSVCIVYYSIEIIYFSDENLHEMNEGYSKQHASIFNLDCKSDSCVVIFPSGLEHS